ncbi:chorismate-binding protein [Bradyrhizobium arachidis]|uniref:chorismate-binding protein n=1 Tax=Bradyrhizobium arachidis TaxID=858423 RepID=UPI001FCD38D6|nr:chorismate-binding protein [Bradyrhizobium arachidis]
MLVDLLLNDLSRVCPAHSVDVPMLCNHVSYVSVHHFVWIVTGELAQIMTPSVFFELAFLSALSTARQRCDSWKVNVARGIYCGSSVSVAGWTQALRSALQRSTANDLYFRQLAV